MLIARIAGAVGVPVFVAACAPAQVPDAIQGELLFNKYGEAGCVQGVFIPGAPPAQQCLPPPDDCDDNAAFAANNPNCLPRDENGNQPVQPGQPVAGAPRDI